MILTVKPAGSLKGNIHAPSSKSHTIRAFIIASQGGTSKITNPSYCDDALVAMRLARILGAKIIRKSKKHIVVVARARKLQSQKINVKESGTVLRFILPLVCLYNQNVKITGEGTLRGRPNLFLTKVIRSRGGRIRGTGPLDSIPLTVRPGRLRGGRLAVKGTLSSQFISALLITCPSLQEHSKLLITGKSVVSQTYITMTQQVLKGAGITINKRGSKTFSIQGQQRFKGLKEFHVPSDYGLVAFLLAAAALTKSRVSITGNFTNKFSQSDEAILPLLRKMGVKFKKTANLIQINGPFQLNGGQFSLKDCPDLVPIMTVLAVFARGKTRLYHIGHVRSKESDRISDLRKELLKIGADIKEKRDQITIEPKAHYRKNCLLNPHRDHRLAMAFSVLGIKLGARVKDIECVSKSYPEFVKDFKCLGARAVKTRNTV